MRAIAAAAVGLTLAACGGSTGNTEPTGRAPTRLELSSPAFDAGETIPRQYACDGRDISPPLRWSGVPRAAKELRLLMRDPDAPGGNFVHWSVVGISPTAAGLAQGRLPRGAIAGDNSFGSIGYRGPCPPRGDKAHHYEITLTALSGRAVLASGTLIGTYARR